VHRGDHGRHHCGVAERRCYDAAVGTPFEFSHSFCKPALLSKPVHLPASLMHLGSSRGITQRFGWDTLMATAEGWPAGGAPQEPQTTEIPTSPMPVARTWRP
jgi:hypothetical protein